MTTTNAIKTEVNVAVHSATYITNTTLHVIQRIPHKRGLDSGYIQKHYAVIENGVLTWVTEGKLQSLLLQVFQPGSSSAVENWKIVFEYRTEPDSEVQKPPIEQLEGFCSKLSSLPPGATYQIFAEVAPDASHVPGWTPGTPLPIFGRTRKDFISWGYGNIGAGLSYEGGFASEDASDSPGRHS